MESRGLFIEAIDEGLSALGSATKEIIYRILQNDYGIAKESLPEKLAELSEILRLAFGAGADSILQYIIERFYIKLQVTPPSWTNLNEAVELVQGILRAGIAKDH